MRKTMYGYKSEVPLSEEFKTLLLEPFLATLKKDRTRTEYRRHILTICAYFYHLRGYRYSFEELDENDVKDYFLGYLSNECKQGNLSKDTFRLRLSCCKGFAFFLEERLPYLAEEGIWNGISEYRTPYDKIIRPAAGPVVSTKNMVSEADIDKVLNIARKQDEKLFVILLLSFRMMLPQNVILSLRKEQFFFADDNGRHVGIVSFFQKEKPVYKRIPSDILDYVEKYWNNCSEGNIFKNQYGHPFNPTNLCHLLKKFESNTGLRVKLGQLRTRGIIDMVAHNPDSLDEIEDYTGLSKAMIKGYGEALDRITVDCIADRTGYSILVKKERNEDV